MKDVLRLIILGIRFMILFFRILLRLPEIIYRMYHQYYETLAASAMLQTHCTPRRKIKVKDFNKKLECLNLIHVGHYINYDYLDSGRRIMIIPFARMKNLQAILKHSFGDGFSFDSYTPYNYSEIKYDGKIITYVIEDKIFYLADFSQNSIEFWISGEERELDKLLDDITGTGCFNPKDYYRILCVCDHENDLKRPVIALIDPRNRRCEEIYYRVWHACYSSAVYKKDVYVYLTLMVPGILVMLACVICVAKTIVMTNGVVTMMSLISVIFGIICSIGIIDSIVAMCKLLEDRPIEDR